MTTEAPKEEHGLTPPGETPGARLPAVTFQHTMEPKNFAEMKDLAKILAESDIVPPALQKKPANVLLTLMFGREVGLSTAQALQNVMVVNGRPSMWGDAVMGKVEQSGLLEYWSDTFDPKTFTATFTCKRKGRPHETTRTFSKADAEAAGLWNKQGPWQGYKPRMCFQRARAFALRDTFADVLKGLRIVEEERDIVELAPEPGKPGVYSKPKRASEVATQQPPAPPPPAEPEAAKQEPPTGQLPPDAVKITGVAKKLEDGAELGVIRLAGDLKVYCADKKMTAYAEQAHKDDVAVLLNTETRKHGKDEREYVVSIDRVEPEKN